MQSEWSKEKASEMLKNVLEELNLTVPELVEALNKTTGMKETKKSVYCKLDRGTFSLAWLLQVLNALDLEIDIKGLEDQKSVHND